MSVIVKMFQIFVQMSDGYAWIMVTVGSDMVGSISMENILNKVMRTLCVALEDLGLNKDVLRRQLIQWVTTGNMGNEAALVNVAEDVQNGVGVRSYVKRMVVQGSVVMVKV